MNLKSNIAGSIIQPIQQSSEQNVVGGLRPNKSLARSSILKFFLLSSIPLLLFVAFFFPSFSNGVRFSYRDVAFYYYPLFQQVQHEWESGRPPLWSPYDNLGQPLAADPTASVFYPVKLIFWLASFKILPYALCFKLYVWFHVILMLYFSYRLPRRIGISRSGSILSCVSYSFAGHIFFQYTNIIYLVGATWTPLIFRLIVETFRESIVSKKIIALSKLSVVYALTILGGEPQIVYLTLVLVFVVSLFTPLKLFVRGAKHSLLSNPNSFVEIVSDCSLDYCKVTDNFRRRCFFALFSFTFVSSFSFVLAAVQILPSLEIIERSTRVQGQTIYSIWEVPKLICHELLDKDASESSDAHSPFSGVLCSNFANSNKNASIYRFSVGPWRWLEFLFPNIGGRQFPQSGRWFNIFPEEIAVWSPSLYFGAYPFILAVSSLRFRRSSPTSQKVSCPRALDLVYIQKWASWLLLITLLASCGGFGLFWLFRTTTALINGTTISPTFSDYDPVGGIYWFFNLLLPKFSAFRYPAKMLTTTAICFSVLAGIGWDRQKDSIRSKKIIVSSIVIAVLGLIGVCCLGNAPFRSIDVIDPLFGKFHPDLAFQSVTLALTQTAVVLSIVLTLLILSKKYSLNHSSHSSSVFSILLLILTATDLYLANSWLVVTSPTKLFQRQSTISRQIIADRTRKLQELQPLLASNDAKIRQKYYAVPPTRIYRFPVWFPPFFQQKSSSSRIDERVLWDVETMFPRYPFNKGVATIDSRGAVMESQYADFVNKLINKQKVNDDLAFLGVDYVVGPRFWTDRLLGEKSSNNENNLDWTVACKEIHGSSRAIIEAPSDLASETGAPQQKSSRKNSIELLSYEPNRIVYLVSCQDSSSLILSEQYWSCWKTVLSEVTPKQAEYLRQERFDPQALDRLGIQEKNIDELTQTQPVAEFLRKVKIPYGGLFCVDMRYRPTRIYVGITISVVGWSLVAISLLAFLFRNKSRRQFPKKIK